MFLEYIIGFPGGRVIKHYYPVTKVVCCCVSKSVVPPEHMQYNSFPLSPLARTWMLVVVTVHSRQSCCIGNHVITKTPGSVSLCLQISRKTYYQNNYAI